uniref:Uncharacterized protein n=1 Tax=Ovis aries TaxID=9940 RepID=A0AC11B553_SHEEP
MAMTLGYWDLRGLAHSIRLLLEYTDSNYEEKKYTMGDAPDYDRSQWLNEKFKLGLDFPNLPYLIDGAHKLTQSKAILRYIARKHNMCGETEEEKIRVDVLENQATDTVNDFIMLCYNPEFEKLKPQYLMEIPGKMKLYSEFLGKRPWFAGDKLTFVDFLVYDVLDVHRIFEPTCLDAFPNLKDFISRFELTYVDLSTYDIVDLHHRLEPKCLDEFTNLKHFLDRFEVLLMDSRLLFLAIWAVFTSLRT